MTEPVQLNDWQKSLAIEYAPMAERIAIREWNKKYRQIETVLPFEDVQALVNLGLVKACSHVEAGRDGLVTYFERYMVGEVQEYLRRLDHASRKVRGLINQLPKDEPLTTENVMQFLDCNQSQAEQVLAAIGHSEISLEDLAKKFTYQMVDSWESDIVHGGHSHLYNKDEVDEDDSDTWLDKDGLASAIANRLGNMDELTQAVIVMSYVEELSSNSISAELETPISVVHKLHVAAIENVRDFVVSWCALC